MKLWAWIRNWWYSGCRQRDIAILWPECKRYSKSLEAAKSAFRQHAAHDSAWLELAPEDAAKIINALE